MGASHLAFSLLVYVVSTPTAPKTVSPSRIRGERARMFVLEGSADLTTCPLISAGGLHLRARGAWAETTGQPEKRKVRVGAHTAGLQGHSPQKTLAPGNCDGGRTGDQRGRRQGLLHSHAPALAGPSFGRTSHFSALPSSRAARAMVCGNLLWQPWETVA